MTWITGFHAVEEALAAARPLDRVVLVRGRHGERIESIVRLAKSRGVPVRFENRDQIDRLAGTREHQGVAALASAHATVELADLLARKTERGILLFLDGIEDPHNLGAIARSALAAGAIGIVIPERRAAGLTDTAERASAGALAHLPVARVKNLVRALTEAKEAGYWMIGLDERAEKSYTEIDLKGSMGIVLGREGEGLHELTRKSCDFLVSLPTAGPVRSLNVSVAAGIMLFEAVRQRRASSHRPQDQQEKPLPQD
ncbi:MAG TPA: 23S rRNA (guanosine(2251)-2'-O)-methyltransferase RlmB [Candidatus Acidoferrales bacterium]|nr:23S rRNA (guanosine(2251)-2'-O)-methyltransferase RlmB [Candidatus Acidoferrales bacterium]